MTQFHRVMGGKAQPPPVILSEAEDPQLLSASVSTIKGAPSMTQFHRVMGGKARTSTTMF